MPFELIDFHGAYFSTLARKISAPMAVESYFPDRQEMRFELPSSDGFMCTASIPAPSRLISQFRAGSHMRYGSHAQTAVPH